ncbi:MAG TPA: glycosyltransferase family 4 protein [Solirubrobacteraceae bacterium]|nr:glycosyltransferase family 4 protein [Solirubrobacteraceae bacterium]
MSVGSNFGGVPAASAPLPAGPAGQPSHGARLLAVSHAAILPANQLVYRELSERGWEITLVVPDRWSHAYTGRLRASPLPGLESALRPTAVVWRGRAQRHLHRVRAGRVVDRFRPDVALLELEPYALAATQWGRALGRRGIPFGLQCWENVDRPLPAPVRALRARVLRDAAFVGARSQTAAELARAWGAVGEIAIAPSPVPGWEPRPRADRPFTIGYVGRLVESKGVTDLLAAVQAMAGERELVLVGEGELKDRLRVERVAGRPVSVLGGVASEAMPDAYAQLDVLVLPSRTTATWKEQFGRVLVEALWCGVPVIGSDSGEIPWVIGLTGGGLVFPEGDTRALAQSLTALQGSPELRRDLAATGRRNVERLFSVKAATDALERLLRGALPAAAHAASEP